MTRRHRRIHVVMWGLLVIGLVAAAMMIRNSGGDVL